MYSIPEREGGDGITTWVRISSSAELVVIKVDKKLLDKNCTAAHPGR